MKETPNDPDLLTDWAICRLEQGDAEEAAEAVRQALHLDPEHASAQLMLSRIASFDGDYEVAAETLERLVDERPNDVEIQYAYALALQAIGRTEAAADAFAFAATGREALSQVRNWLDEVKQDPANAQLRYQIGEVLGKYHSPEDGAAWLRSALDVSPDHRPSLAALIAYHRSAGHQELAESYQRRLHRLAEPGATDVSEK